jgi:hypothetical protein
LLVTGATAVIKVATRPGNKLATDWLLKLLQRRRRKLAAVALANKMARTAWAMMTSGETYRHPPVAAVQIAQPAAYLKRQSVLGKSLQDPEISANLSVLLWLHGGR